MLLTRWDYSAPRLWDSLRNDLNEFGRRSGLFSDIRVKRHGNRISDPFELRVKANSGSHANLVDAGHGVNRSLPILVNLLALDLERTGGRPDAEPVPHLFLLQQPEAHLHPRGQAELASRLVEFVRSRNHHFFIETHSDYLVDRVRVSVRRGLLHADEVSILYFEPRKNAVQIHGLRLDEYGNISNAPPGYRDFFLREMDAVLGLEN